MVGDNYNSNPAASFAMELMGFNASPPPLQSGFPSNPWGWNKNLQSRVVDGITLEMNELEATLDRELTQDEIDEFLELYDVVFGGDRERGISAGGKGDVNKDIPQNGAF